MPKHQVRGIFSLCIIYHSISSQIVAGQRSLARFGFVNSKAKEPDHDAEQPPPQEDEDEEEGCRGPQYNTQEDEQATLADQPEV